MKRYWFLAALGIVLAFSGTALAINADFSGEYYVEGIYNDNLALFEDAGSSDAYMQMRLRLRTVFEISNNISLTTRLDGLDKRWGDDDNAKASSQSSVFSGLIQPGTGTPNASNPFVRTSTTIKDENNIDLEWVYMTIKTGLGGFLVGRQKGNVWGTTFAETEGPRDRITYVLPIKNSIIAAVYEKTRELDGNDLTKTDADWDKYYLTFTQKGENFKAGLLYGYYDFATFQDMWQNRQTAWLKTQAANAGDYYTDTDRPYLLSDVAAHVFIPYFTGKFGPFGIQAEVDYAFGSVEYDSPYRVTPTDVQFLTTAATLGPDAARALLASGIENSDREDSKDGNVLSYNVELTYDLNKFTFIAGYASFSGDADLNDDEVNAYGYIEPGEDWQKLAILTGTDYGVHGVLGGLGNLAGGGKANWDGYNMFYLGASYAINDKMRVSFLYGNSKANDVTERDASRATVYSLMGVNNADWDDDHGSEYDLGFEWQIFDNLRYQFIAAYLDAGDYWKQGNDDAEIDDTYLLWHRLTVDF